MRYSITLLRDNLNPKPNNSTLGTDALNALSSIPGVIDLEILSESEEEVVITYEYTLADNKFLELNIHLYKFNLSRKRD